MTANTLQPVGPPDFHDGHILSLLQAGDEIRITVQGSSGKHYVVCFEGVRSIESESPEGMMLYALNETHGQSGPLWHYEFVNWYGDEPSDERARSYLRIVARSFTVTAAIADQ
jgi:hypothetical protein